MPIISMMAQPAGFPEPSQEGFHKSDPFADERPPLWVIQEAFEGERELEHPQDVYIQHLLQSLSPELLDTLSPEQYQLLKRSLLQYHRRHLVDVRGVIPFLFTRFYFVFLFGKDRRGQSQAVAFERRHPPTFWNRLAGWLVMIAVLSLFVFGALGMYKVLTR